MRTRVEDVRTAPDAAQDRELERNRVWGVGGFGSGGFGNGYENSSSGGRCLGGKGGGLHARIKQRTRMWLKGLVARTRHLGGGGGCCASQRYKGHNKPRWYALQKTILDASLFSFYSIQFERISTFYYISFHLIIYLSQ